MGNGQLSSWPAETVEEAEGLFAIGVGQSVDFPVVLPPLEAGQYEIEISGHPYLSGRDDGPTVVDWPAVRMPGSIRLTVRGDEKAARAHDDELLRRIQQGDVLALYIATLSRNPKHGAALVPLLLNIDPRVARSATEALRALKTLPDHADIVVSQALFQWAYSAQDGSWQVRDALGQLAASMKTDVLLDACIELAKAEKDQRLFFVQIIARFPQDRTTPILHEYVADADRLIRDNALHRLAERKDVPARRILLSDIRDPTFSAQRRTYHILALENYAPGDAEVMEMLKASTGDPDGEVRAAAHRVIDRLNRAGSAPERK